MDSSLQSSGDPSASAKDAAEASSAVVFGGFKAARTLVQSKWFGVIKIACFFLGFFLIAIVLDLVIGSGLRAVNTSSFGVSNQIMKGKINAEIVISGSSRALTHYDSRIIQEKTGRSTFNIGLNGSQSDMQLARLRTYLKYNAKPALLIQNLDLFSFHVTHEGVYDPGQYLPYLKEPEIYQALVRVNPEIWKSRVIPLYGFAVEDLRFTWMLGLGGRFGYNPPEDHYQGFKPRNLMWTGDFEHFKRMNSNGVHVEIEPDGVRVIEELFELCKSHGIELLLVYSPEYLQMQSLTLNRSEVFSRFKEFQERFGSTFWDYSGSPISFRRELFYNSQHLNAEGAEAFSKDVADRIVADAKSFKLTVISPKVPN